MARDRTFVALDVGTTKICTLVAELQDDGELEVIGLGVVPSRGVRRGQVVDLDEATEAIQSSLERAERSSGTKITSALVSVTGGQIASTNSHGVVAVAGRERLVGQSDVGRVLEAARTISAPSQSEVLHVVPRGYTLDGQDGVRNPLGMHGFRLEVEAHIVFAATAPLQNLTTCLQRLGIQVADLVLAPLASAEAVLSEEEREMGVVLADIGAGTTDIVIYQDGSVNFCKVLGIGGNHVTNDLALFLHTQFGAAEEIKNRYGHALPQMVAQEDMVWVAGFGSEGERPVLQRRLAEIVYARVDEILQLVQQEVQRAGFAGRVPAGLVLTGGSANLRGIEALAREKTEGPARVGIPQGAHGLAESLDDPAYATSIGLLLWGLRYGVWDSYPAANDWLAWPRLAWRWLRDLMPGDG